MKITLEITVEKGEGEGSPDAEDVRQAIIDEMHGFEIWVANETGEEREFKVTDIV